MNPADFGFSPLWFHGVVVGAPMVVGFLAAAVVHRYAKPSGLLSGMPLALVLGGVSWCVVLGWSTYSSESACRSALRALDLGVSEARVLDVCGQPIGMTTPNQGLEPLRKFYGPHPTRKISGKVLVFGFGMQVLYAYIDEHGRLEYVSVGFT